MKVLEPQNDRVLIKPIEEDEQMYGNIVIPDMGKERPEMGQVIAVGPGRQSEFGQYIRVNAQVGDIVELFGNQIRIQAWAQAAGTISYEVATSLNLRLPKTYTR